jgi:hypothetical protein
MRQPQTAQAFIGFALELGPNGLVDHRGEVMRPLLKRPQEIP